MTSRLFIIQVLLSLLTLVLGHPLQPGLFNANPTSPAPKLSIRTDVGAVEELADKGLGKRDHTDLPYYACSQDGLQFCEAWCKHNVLHWNCISQGGSIKNRKRTGYEQYYRECPQNFICMPEYLSKRTDYPTPPCGKKAACIPQEELTRISAKRDSSTCEAVVGDTYYEGKRPRISSTILDAADWDNYGVATPRAPAQITLWDGWSNKIQGVGPADEQNGQFVSLPFTYHGAIKECVGLSSLDPDVYVWTTII